MPGTKNKEAEPEPVLKAVAKGFYALQDRDWTAAATAYREARQLCGTSNQEDLVLRAEICLFYGLALKNLHDLERAPDTRTLNDVQLNAKELIRQLWTELLQIWAKVPDGALGLDRTMIENVRKHWIMCV